MSRDPGSFWDGSSFKPQIGKRPGDAGAARAPTFKRTVLRRLALIGGVARTKAARPARRPARRDVRAAPPFSRRCVIKARYVQMDIRGTKAARLHLDYIERDGVERDGSRGRLFDAGGDVDREAFGVPIQDEKRQFRFIVSPEDGEDLDLRDFTSRLVNRMEKDLGRGLRWAAVCHYNTDNPHVHLVVRGVDSRGAELRIDRAYISEFMRLRAQELATLELGPRSEIDVQRQLSREVTLDRLSGIDRRLAGLALPDGSLDMATLTGAQRLSRPHALARLQSLEDLALVERTSPVSWRFVDGWQDALQRLGERGDIIKRMHHALRGHPGSYRVFEGDGAIEGVVRHKGLHDELGAELYAIVEEPGGQAHYVRVDHTTAEQLKEGERVRVMTSAEAWVKAPDHVIAHAAVANAGVYSPAVHLQQLGGMPVAVGGHHVTPEAAIEVNCRRLERLERYTLVSCLPDGTWRVPPDLIEQLRDRERTQPRHRVHVERLDLQLQHDRSKDRGPDRGL